MSDFEKIILIALFFLLVMGLPTYILMEYDSVFYYILSIVVGIFFWIGIVNMIDTNYYDRGF